MYTTGAQTESLVTEHQLCILKITLNGFCLALQLGEWSPSTSQIYAAENLSCCEDTTFLRNTRQYEIVLNTITF